MTRLSSENVEFKVTRANYIRWFFHSILSRCKEIIKFLLCFVISESDNIQTCCILLFHIDGKTIGSNNITFWRIWNYFLLSDNTIAPNSIHFILFQCPYAIQKIRISKLLKTVNHKGTFPILEIDGSLRIGVEKSYFNSNRWNIHMQMYNLIHLTMEFYVTFFELLINYYSKYNQFQISRLDRA